MISSPRGPGSDGVPVRVTEATGRGDWTSERFDFGMSVVGREELRRRSRKPSHRAYHELAEATTLQQPATSKAPKRSEHQAFGPYPWVSVVRLVGRVKARSRPVQSRRELPSE